MRCERDIEVQVAGSAAVEALAALAAQAQALAVRGSLGDARLDDLRRGAKRALVVVFRQRDLQVQLRAVERLLEREAHGDLEVLAPDGAFRPCRCATPARERLE